MKFSRLFLNRLHHLPPPADTVVVIDVLRSFTTAAIALARGAAAVYPVGTAVTASLLAERVDNPLLVGSIGGGDPVPGFDLGNSPSSLDGVELAGRNVLLSTVAGVRGLQRFRRARELYAASLVCARATAAAIRAHGADEVCFVITGEWVDRDGDEDIACADYLEALLRGDDTDPPAFGRRVRASSFGQRFSSGDWPNLPRADLDLACEVDRYDFAMPVRREDDHLVIR